MFVGNNGEARRLEDEDQEIGFDSGMEEDTVVDMEPPGMLQEIKEGTAGQVFEVVDDKINVEEKDTLDGVLRNLANLSQKELKSYTYQLPENEAKMVLVKIFTSEGLMGQFTDEQKRVVNRVLRAIHEGASDYIFDNREELMMVITVLVAAYKGAQSKREIAEEEAEIVKSVENITPEDKVKAKNMLEVLKNENSILRSIPLRLIVAIKRQGLRVIDFDGQYFFYGNCLFLFEGRKMRVLPANPSGDFLRKWGKGLSMEEVKFFDTKISFREENPHFTETEQLLKYADSRHDAVFLSSIVTDFAERQQVEKEFLQLTRQKL